MTLLHRVKLRRRIALVPFHAMVLGFLWIWLPAMIAKTIIENRLEQRDQCGDLLILMLAVSSSAVFFVGHLILTPANCDRRLQLRLAVYATVACTCAFGCFFIWLWWVAR